MPLSCHWEGHGSGPWFCHCEHPKGTWQSLFSLPHSHSYALQVPEIAASGRKSSLLAMTVEGVGGIGYRRLPRRPKYGLLAMTLEENRPSGDRHCEHPKGAWQSRFFSSSLYKQKSYMISMKIKPRSQIFILKQVKKFDNIKFFS